MRRWLASDQRLRFVVAACWRAEDASRRWVMSHTTFVSVVSRSLRSRGWPRWTGGVRWPLARRVSLVSSRRSSRHRWLTRMRAGQAWSPARRTGRAGRRAVVIPGSPPGRRP